jgi:hypothetical protein
MRFVVAWRFLDDAGAQTGRSERFADREQAEAWLGASWEDLREQGVVAVELCDEDDGSVLYRMSLADG